MLINKKDPGDIIDKKGSDPKGDILADANQKLLFVSDNAAGIKQKTLEDYPDDVKAKMNELCNKVLNGELGRTGTNKTLQESEIAILISIEKIGNIISNEMPSDIKALGLQRICYFFSDFTSGGGGCFYDISEQIDHILMKTLFGNIMKSSKQISMLSGFGYDSGQTILYFLCGMNCSPHKFIDILPSYKETVFAQQDKTADGDSRQFTFEDKAILNERLIPEAIEYALKNSPYV